MVSLLAPVANAAPRPFAHRAAFLLNRNARAVSDKLVERLAAVVPAGDLFLSRTMEDASVFARTIARRGYGQVFLGGGDGTLVTCMNLLRQHSAAEGLAMPTVGVLKLGTGNAMATALGALDPLVDASHVLQHGPARDTDVDFVETDDGTLTPFAGMGYDGAVLNDYMWLKQRAKHSPVGRALAETVGGYLGAMLVRSVPNELRRPPTTLRIKSSSDAIFMRPTRHGDVEEVLPAGTVLFEGKAATVCVGSIPYFGFGFTMFPFAMTKPGHMQMRIVGAPIPSILAHLYPGVWKGTWRHDRLLDFMVKDVEVESDQPLPYQVGGDAAGEQKKLHFKVSSQPVKMTTLGERLVPQGHTVLQLGPARMMVRLPR
ncbi:MAG TPA: diacylglycerol kinase family protein [Myxococcota bacterium]